MVQQRPFTTVRKLWVSEDGELFIAETGVRRTVSHPLRYGRLINLTTTAVGEEQPLDTIVRFMPYTDFKPFRGEIPEKVVGLLKEAELSIELQLGFWQRICSLFRW